MELVAAIGAFLVLVLVARWLGSRRRRQRRHVPAPSRIVYHPRSEGSRYARVPVFMTPAEQRFADVLARVVVPPERFLAKVRLGDLVAPTAQEKSKEWWAALNAVNRKHVDFLWLDAYWRPLAAIELDDRSHDREERQSRDHFVNRTLAGVGLPVVRVRNRHQYDPAQIRALLEEAQPAFALARRTAADGDGTPHRQGRRAGADGPSAPTAPSGS